jgi:hypothetical protein
MMGSAGLEPVTATIPHIVLNAIGVSPLLVDRSV